MWEDFYRNGGWGMYPTTLFGFVLILMAVLVVLRPERRWVPVVAVMGVVTFASGLLGTSVGLVKTFRFLPEVPKVDQLEIATLGCAESLNNIILALILVVLAGLIATVAALRAGLAKRPSLEAK